MFLTLRKIFSLLFIFSTLATMAQQASINPSPYSIPFKLTSQNNIVVKAILNTKDTLSLMLHTAASDFTLTQEATAKITSLNFIRTDSIKSWGGNANTSRYSEHNTIAIAGHQWTGIKIWENKNSGPETDGKFGLDLFGKKAIEIDFDKQVIIIHEALPKKIKEYQKLKLTTQDEMIFIEATSLIGAKTYPNNFLIHSGYSGAILFDDQFASQTKIDSSLKIIGEKSLKDSYGNVLKTKKAILPCFSIAKILLKNVPVAFFQGAIGRQKMSIIGGDLLKRFNFIINAERNFIYLKPNRLKNTSYLNT
ncbi:hypothetical protein QF042_003421 [Pedobacter sp. W3I1]|uniref:hypothetical protein n=1 Tax=Pedobacter sp. W3I1 TaxID=3042291 RepID=UPI0027866496|nr:hypothetical protein [Pedobacter sp. W3I1]MDQ0639856.1 hypothetical protein [Pedobacter sp. W3I1]